MTFWCEKETAQSPCRCDEQCVMCADEHSTALSDKDFPEWMSDPYKEAA